MDKNTDYNHTPHLYSTFKMAGISFWRVGGRREVGSVNLFTECQVGNRDRLSYCKYEMYGLKELDHPFL